MDAAIGSAIICCSKFVERDSVAAFWVPTAPRSPAYFPDRNGGPFHTRPEREISGDHACLETLVGNKLYVGNLSYNVTASQLQELFAQHGTVQSAEIINDRDTGRSKGFGFVEMGSDAEAQAAATALHGTEMDGRALTVNEAKPRADRPHGGGGGGGGRGGYGGGGGGGRGGFGGGGGRGGGGGGYGGGGGGGRGRF
jgi:hypothetical protein